MEMHELYENSAFSRIRSSLARKGGKQRGSRDLAFLCAPLGCDHRAALKCIDDEIHVRTAICHPGVGFCDFPSPPLTCFTSTRVKIPDQNRNAGS